MHRRERLEKVDTKCFDQWRKYLRIAIRHLDGDWSTEGGCGFLLVPS